MLDSADSDIPGTVIQELKVHISTRHDPENDFISSFRSDGP